MKTNPIVEKATGRIPRLTLGGLVILSGAMASAQVIPIDPLTGVTSSSEIPAPFNRLDDYLVDGSGLNGESHTPVVQPNMWLSRGTAYGGEDLDPWVVFDLGATHQISRIRVWNYNESPPNLTSRGVNALTVEYGATLDFGQTVPGITSLAQADGTTAYAGEVFEDFEPFNARYLRFDIDSNHGGDNQFYGLSEVQFEGVIVGVSLDETTFLSSRAAGTVVGSLSTTPAEAGETFSYQMVSGEGDDDNAKFQLSGEQLELADFDFGGSSEGQEFSVRVRATSAPAGQVTESVLTIRVLRDSDGDELADSWEQRWSPGNLDRLSGLGNADADGDGLSDLAEYRLSGAFPDLDPTLADSDGDGLADGAERAGAGARPVTDPTVADTDGDGLSDGVESNTGILVDAADSGSDPTLADSDGDGANDGKEVARGSDPNDASSLPSVVLAAYWDFESEANPQPDRSEFGNDAEVLVGASWVNDDERGGVMEFDGFDAYLEAADSESLSIEGDLSIVAWVKVDDFNGFRGIVGKTAGDLGNQPAPYDLYFLQNGAQSGGELRFFTGSPSAFGQVTGASVPILDQWHHVAVTRIDNEVILYFDGEEDARGVVAGAMRDADGTLRIGNRADLVTDFAGRLDDVAIFQGGLSAGEVQQVMAGDFSAFGLGGPLELRVTREGGGLRFEWETRAGKVYDLVSATDLATSPADWPVYQSDGIVYGGIAGTGSTAVRENVPLIGERRFFALRERNP